jgi:hypothetical protein
MKLETISDDMKYFVFRKTNRTRGYAMNLNTTLEYYDKDDADSQSHYDSNGSPHLITSSVCLQEDTT